MLLEVYGEVPLKQFQLLPHLLALCIFTDTSLQPSQPSQTSQQPTRLLHQQARQEPFRTNDPSTLGENSLSALAKTGIIVAGALGLIGLCTLSTFLILRKRKRSTKVYGGIQRGDEAPIQELEDQQKFRVHEMANSQLALRHELGDDRRSRIAELDG